MRYKREQYQNRRKGEFDKIAWIEAKWIMRRQNGSGFCA
jgi:hypothetical protein